MDALYVGQDKDISPIGIGVITTYPQYQQCTAMYIYDINKSNEKETYTSEKR
jgi:hypothetical protein